MAGTATAAFMIYHNDRHNSGCTVTGARPKQALAYPTQHSFFESDVANPCGINFAAFCENWIVDTFHSDAGEYNTGGPLYSFFLADTFSMRAPYEQYGLYLASLTGGAVMANSFFKAFNLAKYVKYSQQGYEKEAQYAADMAQVHPHELERAGRTVARLRARGVATALAFPALWIAWRLLSHTSKNPTQAQSRHHKTP